MSTFSTPASTPAHDLPIPESPSLSSVEGDSGNADSDELPSSERPSNQAPSDNMNFDKRAQWVQQLLTDLFPKQSYSGRYLTQLLQQRNIAPPLAASPFAHPLAPLAHKSAESAESTESAESAESAKSAVPFDRHRLAGFLHPDHYHPTSPFAFGDEMHRAIARLQQARDRHEQVTIWGDFDADGLTATAVLWDGLRQFFPQTHLSYTIPNRLTESHGLNDPGLDRLAEQGCDLIITCDTGSTNLDELAYAHTLGIDVIITDHHTLADERPNVVAQINPRTLPSDHPLAHLSGVAVAYKLVEALYETWPDVPQQPLERILDLVAIGLITDLVDLKGDCRYLAQRGIQQLQTLLTQQPPSRPGIAQLLKLCKRNGDRPTDISFGIGPRINAISRIHGDATFAIELLTSQDSERCRQLAEETELANSRRKALQRDVMNQLTTRLTELDLSTTQVIVLADPQWSIGVLGLVAGQIAQEYNRPTILLSMPSPAPPASPAPLPLAKGSARSARNINLYELVKRQSHLLHRFGGHPFAAGLSIAVDNIPLFRDGINQACRTQYGDIAQAKPSSPTADLTVTVAELGRELFRELKLLEPCGMGNPVPRLLIRDCEFKERSNRNIKDFKGGKLRYIKTNFRVCDRTCPEGFPGKWWGHYQDELPDTPCDAIVELDFNSYERRYEIRLLELFPNHSPMASNPTIKSPILLDQRQKGAGEQGSGGRFNPNSKLQTPNFERPTPSPYPRKENDGDRIIPTLQRPNAPTPEGPLQPPTSNLQPPTSNLQPPTSPPAPLTLTQCPHNWGEWEDWLQKSVETGQPLAIAFSLPTPSPPTEIWKQLVGIAKYLGRTQAVIDRTELAEILGIGDRVLSLGLTALVTMGFHIQSLNNTIAVIFKSDSAEALEMNSAQTLSLSPIYSTHQIATINVFLNAIQEVQFQQRYFSQVAIDTLEDALKQ